MAIFTIVSIQGLICLGAVLLFYLSYHAIYNIYFHPLSIYPGPKTNAITKLPALFNRLTGRQQHSLHALHQKYGDFVRVGPNELSVITAAAWKDIYDYRRNGLRGFPKDTKNFYSQSKKGATSMLTADDDDHARMRRVFSNAFSNRALSEQEGLLNAYTNTFIEKLQLKSNEAKVDLVQFFNFVTFDSVADLTFGQPLHLLDNMKYNSWVENFFFTAKYLSISSALRNLPIFGKLALLALPEGVKEKLKWNAGFCRESVNRRLKAADNAHPDFWSFVLQAEGKGALTVPEMYANSVLFMVAGTETTATALSGLIYYLLRSPEKMTNLTDIIRTSFESESEMTMLTLPRVDYLQACIQEGLRIYPPVAVGLPRTVPKEGGQISGKPLPGGCTVMFSAYSAYRSPRNFTDPDEFHPERWLSPTTRQYEADQKDVMQPFSYGPRSCIGKNLAYHSIRLVLAKLLWHFDIELCEESSDWDKQKCFMLWEKKPLFVRLKRREL